MKLSSQYFTSEAAPRTIFQPQKMKPPAATNSLSVPRTAVRTQVPGRNRK